MIFYFIIKTPKCDISAKLWPIYKHLAQEEEVFSANWQSASLDF